MKTVWELGTTDLTNRSRGWTELKREEKSGLTRTFAPPERIDLFIGSFCITTAASKRLIYEFRLLKRIDDRVWRIFHPWVVGEEVAGPVQGRLSAADFFGGGFIVRDVELFEPALIVRMLRFVAPNACFQFRVL